MKAATEKERQCFAMESLEIQVKRSRCCLGCNAMADDAVMSIATRATVVMIVILLQCISSLLMKRLMLRFYSRTLLALLHLLQSSDVEMHLIPLMQKWAEHSDGDDTTVARWPTFGKTELRVFEADLPGSQAFRTF